MQTLALLLVSKSVPGIPPFMEFHQRLLAVGGWLPANQEVDRVIAASWEGQGRDIGIMAIPYGCFTGGVGEKARLLCEVSNY